MRCPQNPDKDRDRVYRRCGCRDDHRRQLGTTCPHLATDRHHGRRGLTSSDQQRPASERHTRRPAAPAP
ncbi:hypothetical protein [Kitasatospora purpeofusca]|uniref:SWIM-type domain-containing protein n=1 Tax=Kitasatospora purpeofusca TaxID=67352 RepID=A0ABZ1TTB1_9ACTN|nr:hypothetical protein [Kitasatospora purpeofusca]